MEFVNNLEKSNKSLSETNKLLENKLAKTEASAYKAFKEKADEIAILKNTINTNKIEIDTLRKELTKEKKLSKEKEKEVLRLGQQCDNLGENIKNLKHDMADLKSENKKLLKKDSKCDKGKKNQNISKESSGNF